MKSLTAAAIGFATLLLASGCTMPGSSGNGDPSPTSSTYTTRQECQYSLCPAQTASKNYRAPMERYGLHQINDDASEEGRLSLEGDLAAWQWSDFEGTQGVTDFVSHIAAFNISAGKITTVEDEPYYHNTLVFQSEGRVVFTRSPEEGAPEGPGASYMVLWDSGTQQKRKLETRHDGQVESQSISGAWVSYWTTHNTDSSQDGVWLLNTESAQSIQLFHRPSEEEFVSGTEWAPNSNSDVEGRFAYFSYSRLRTDGSRVTDNKVVQYDIPTGATRFLYEGTEGNVQIKAGERYVAWTVPGTMGGNTNSRIRVYDLATNQSWIPTLDEEGTTGFPHVGGEWLTYSRNLGQVPRGLVALHLPTGAKHLLFDFNNGLSANEGATDGIRFVADVHRHNTESFDSLGQDLYWGTLPASAS